MSSLHNEECGAVGTFFVNDTERGVPYCWRLFNQHTLLSQANADWFRFNYRSRNSSEWIIRCVLQGVCARSRSAGETYYIHIIYARPVTFWAKKCARQCTFIGGKRDWKSRSCCINKAAGKRLLAHTAKGATIIELYNLFCVRLYQRQP